MAQVAYDTQTRITRFLEYLIREWQNLPNVAQQWNTWEEDERLDFVLEWPLRTDRLQEIETYDKQGLLTPAQSERYKTLQSLIAAYSPLLKQLLAD